MSIAFFAVIAAISIAAAIGVITSRQPVHSALFLLANFATLAILYVTLEAQFLAAVQIIIYAGGIVILILFVIMLLGSEDIPADESRPWTAYAGIVLGIIMLGGIASGTIGAFSGVELPTQTLADGTVTSMLEGGAPKSVGMELFTKYLLPFEMTAILILVALLGALLLGRRPEAGETEASEVQATEVQATTQQLSESSGD